MIGKDDELVVDLRDGPERRPRPRPPIVQAFRALKPSTPPPDYPDVFLKELVAAGLDSATVGRLVNP
jgi:hypothetical protein